MDIEEILGNLTVREKIRLLSGVGDWHTYDCNGKVPSVMMTDGPHGIRKIEDEGVGDMTASKPATCFPTASALASGWDPGLAFKVAEAISEEAAAEDISIVLGCGINIKRSPLCGRNFEYFSEDPFLTGEVAKAYISGLQKNGTGASLKHFAVNSQETRRMTSNSQVDERALREIYLSAFETVVKEAEPATVMASYNKVNGTYSSANRHLLTDILRKEWGYKGAVVSDWGACIDAVSCYKAGMNLEMPDNKGYHEKVLNRAYEQGFITDREIDEWAGKVLGSFTALSDKNREKKPADMPAHNTLAREAEEQCAVLLKNEGVFPIPKTGKLIVIGELAEHMRYQGGGSSHINSAYHKNAVDALKDEGYQVVYIRGYRNESDREDVGLTAECLKRLRAEAKGDYHVLFFAGLTESYEGEGYDRKDLNIPGNQVELLERVAGIAEHSRIAAVSFGGAPMDLSFDENVSGLLHMYLGGQAVGEAMAALVSGKANPSGKLAETFPKVITDTPAWRYFAPPHDDVEYRESIFVGYRYYETYHVPVRYPFGYGLSYTTFEYSDLKVPDLYEDKDIKITVTVKNTGKRAGSEVAELYVIPEKGNYLRSAIELKAFSKVYLEPGEEKEVEFTLNGRSFSVYDIEKKTFSVIGGVYTIAVGASIQDLRLKANIIVKGGNYFRNERDLFPGYFESQPHGMDIPQKEFERLYGKKLSEFRNRKRGEYDMTCSYSDVTSRSLFGHIVRGVVSIGLRLMFPGKKKTDPDMQMTIKGVEEGSLEGLIATSGGIATPKLVDMLVLNANRKYARAFLRMFQGREV